VSTTSFKVAQQFSMLRFSYFANATVSVVYVPTALWLTPYASVLYMNVNRIL